MIQVEATMSSAKQITVPREVREALKLAVGDKIAFKLAGKSITVDKAETQEEKVKRIFDELAEWRESLPQEVKDNIKKHAGWTVDQFHEYYDNLPETKAYIKEKYGVQA